ncbi:MAG: helix-turn-helix transcriptional regulator [Calditrichia bacterium]
MSLNSSPMTDGAKENMKAVGVTRQTIISIEKGKYVPSTLLALKLVKFFDKPFEEVFYLIENIN